MLGSCLLWRKKINIMHQGTNIVISRNLKLNANMPQ